MHYGIADFIGNIGVAMVIAAYFLLQLGRWRAHDLSYLVCNLTGAALVLFSLAYAFNLSAAIIQLFWIGISLFGIARALRAR
ncbi:MAG: permease [Chromatiales bacterium]|jgi:hypothetical protein|nr:permease [Chromatiales bacterium]MDX9766069.1 permease [Ectothiorhodospiraceae bacterium]